MISRLQPALLEPALKLFRSGGELLLLLLGCRTQRPHLPALPSESYAQTSEPRFVQTMRLPRPRFGRKQRERMLLQVLDLRAGHRRDPDVVKEEGLQRLVEVGHGRAAVRDGSAIPVEDDQIEATAVAVGQTLPSAEAGHGVLSP